MGEKSKTDKIDTRILSEMGLELELRQWQPVSGDLLELKQLTRERDSPVRSRTMSANHLHAFSHQGKSNKSSISRTVQHIKFIDKQVKEIEEEIKTLVNQDEKLKRVCDTIRGTNNFMNASKKTKNRRWLPLLPFNEKCWD